MCQTFVSLIRLSAFLGVLLGMQAARAVDGVVLIDQNRALAGAVTPGDAPGFPITISLPGSYRLASNLTPPLYKNAIEVTAANVTIDLNGFSLIAQPRTDACCFDIGVLQTGPGAKGLTIYNGSIVGFAGPFQFTGAQGPNGFLLPYPVVLRDLILGVPMSRSADVQLQSFSRVERVSGPDLTVYAQCPSTVVNSAFQGVHALVSALSIPGAKCSFSNNATE